ncbi:MAG: hypothetical protein KL839_16980 [Rhizobium sp.]|nr:hypothetical protein [Rhizobium sp.]
MGAEKRDCIFCGAVGGLSREHVLPKWLQLNVGGSLEGTFTGIRSSFIGERLDERKFSGGNFTLKRICTNCNNGWMSQLEDRFALVLPKLESFMRPSQLSKTERHTVSMWIVKTGIVAHLSANYRRILPESFPAKLQCGRVIPRGVKVFCGTTEPEKRIIWAQGNVVANTVRKADIETFDAYKDTFVFFIAIRGAVIGFAWHGLDNAAYKLDVCVPGLHQVYPRPISPPRKHVLEHVHMAAMSIRLAPR